MNRVSSIEVHRSAAVRVSVRLGVQTLLFNSATHAGAGVRDSGPPSLAEEGSRAGDGLVHALGEAVAVRVPALRPLVAVFEPKD